jgi:hypothetical protein
MCDLVTFAVPESRAHLIPEAEAFSVAPFFSEGGGHRYADGMRIFALLRGDCSCGVLSRHLIAAVAEFLARTAAECGSVEVVAHRHSGDFATESFAITRTVALRATDLLNNPSRFVRDVRYLIGDAPSN